MSRRPPLARTTLAVLLLATALVGSVSTRQAVAGPAARGFSEDSADLSVTAADLSGIQQQPLIFTATIINNGPDPASSVHATLTVPTSPGKPVLQWGWSPNGECFDNGTPIDRVDCSLGTLQPYQEVHAYLSVVPAVSGTLVSTVTVGDSSPFDANVSNNTATATALILPLSPRDVTLAGKRQGRQVRMSGKVSAKDGFTACDRGQTVLIQNYVHYWRELSRGVTNASGQYTILIPYRPGRYRALAEGSSVLSGKHFCAGSTSNVVPITSHTK